MPKAVEKLRVIEPEENPRVLQIYRQYERLKEKVARLGLKVSVGGGLQIHPPLSAACGILDVEEVMTYLHDDPALIHRLFEKMLLGFFRLKDFHDRYFGTKTTTIGLANDHSAFVSDPMYRRHVMPYNMIIYARYGQNGRSFATIVPNSPACVIRSHEGAKPISTDHLSAPLENTIMYPTIPAIRPQAGSRG